MKKIITLALLVSLFSITEAQTTKKKTIKKTATKTSAVVKKTTPEAPVATPTTEFDIKFEKDLHNFGTIPEGPQATVEFKFKNTGKAPITISHVQASCGCTVPEWTKEPIMPGKTGTIKAVYYTQGRPGSFTKTLTVQSQAGDKFLTISGNVEKVATDTPPAGGTQINIGK